MNSQRIKSGETTERIPPSIPVTGSTDQSGIIVRGLTRFFGGVRAVDDLSFSVRAHTIFGLVGPDGAGKTTTMRMLCSLIDPTGGSALIHGLDIRSDRRRIRQLMGYMPQRFSLYGDLTVLENLEFYSDIYQIPPDIRKKRIGELLEFSNLSDHVGKLADQLSGGMKQKLALSCNLIHAPRYLFLDEPTIGVDPVARRELWKILFDLRDQGTTIFVSTPYMDEAERCDEIGLMDQGRIILQGPPRQIIRHFSKQIMGVYSKDNHLVREAMTHSDYAEDAYMLGDALHIVTTQPSALSKDLDELSFMYSLELTKQLTQPSLEDVFVHLVKTNREVM
ncbi:ABC transporter ATP-binding protein [Proteiniclasticum sp. QWL-01]|uniref:ABC transporter ATP-binding protein n=1 Tax=Proteiniclasticum sp. QWL-01 TaxID=3036945 RepID=UPI00240FD7A5|nr:ABC transporter ATP-binding protein [Proteiniclasticum sp. QWL-01]WFF72289.1 ABC transporter ATP-binding protein [Proteiniclasticum sp. QWL-01]